MGPLAAHHEEPAPLGVPGGVIEQLAVVVGLDETEPKIAPQFVEFRIVVASIEIGVESDFEVVVVVAGAVDVWVIERPDGEEAFLVATKDAVKQVDLAAGRVVIDGAALSTGD